MPPKIVTVRLGRIHAEGTKVNYNEGKVDGLVRELQLEGLVSRRMESSCDQSRQNGERRGLLEVVTGI